MDSPTLDEYKTYEIFKKSRQDKNIIIYIIDTYFRKNQLCNLI